MSHRYQVVPSVLEHRGTGGEYCFNTSLSAQSWQYRDRKKPKAGTMPYSYFKWLQGLFIVYNTIGNTVRSTPLNSLERCICTTTITNIRPDRDSNLVPLNQVTSPSRYEWVIGACSYTGVQGANPGGNTRCWSNGGIMLAHRRRR